MCQNLLLMLHKEKKKNLALVTIECQTDVPAQLLTALQARRVQSHCE